ncbi:DUF6033 family protein [Clostridium lundense]|uniref:DUF6033 family protein n=1 Tax=Clostridium lundense TaxID=319475 RepID=UPI0004839AFD|nr:DUF6033 family protein [Clostridium lundense]
MITNLNSINSSFINNSISTHKSSNEINYKDLNSSLFATQLKNAKNTDIYLNEIKSCYPNTAVTIKSMTARDVQKYYEKWKNKAVCCSGFSHSVTVSPKVLERMEKDPKYAEQMLQKIKKAAIPEGFGNATIYEYKVIVRDDGEIETMACAEWKNEKKQNTKNDDEEKKKAKNKKLELLYWHRRIYELPESQAISKEEIKMTPFAESQYLFNIGVVNKIKNENKVINLK